MNPQSIHFSFTFFSCDPNQFRGEGRLFASQKRIQKHVSLLFEKFKAILAKNKTP